MRSRDQFLASSGPSDTAFPKVSKVERQKGLPQGPGFAAGSPTLYTAWAMGRDEEMRLPLFRTGMDDSCPLRKVSAYILAVTDHKLFVQCVRKLARYPDLI